MNWIELDISIEHPDWTGLDLVWKNGLMSNSGACPPQSTRWRGPIPARSSRAFVWRSSANKRPHTMRTCMYRTLLDAALRQPQRLVNYWWPNMRLSSERDQTMQL